MRKIALLLATLALVTAGCGGDDEDSGGGGTSTAVAPAATTPAEDTGSASGDVAIAMKDIKFDPAEATATVGQKVVWTNEDTAPHNVVGGDIKSPDFGQGETFEYTPEEAGTIEYVCTLHPGMDGTLTVTDG